MDNDFSDWWTKNLPAIGSNPDSQNPPFSPSPSPSYQSPIHPPIRTPTPNRPQGFYPYTPGYFQQFYPAIGYQLSFSPAFSPIPSFSPPPIIPAFESFSLTTIHAQCIPYTTWATTTSRRKTPPARQEEASAADAGSGADQGEVGAMDERDVLRTSQVTTFERDSEKLRNHWKRVSIAVKLFESKYLEAERTIESGGTREDILTEALQNYQELTNKAFKYHDTWDAVRRIPKFLSAAASCDAIKRCKTSIDGIKAAKARGRKKIFTSDEGSTASKASAKLTAIHENLEISTIYDIITKNIFEMTPTVKEKQEKVIVFLLKRFEGSDDFMADPRTKFGFTVIAHILLSPGVLGPLAYYKSLVNQGKLKHDACQERVALELDNLLGRLDRYEEDMEEYHANLAKWEENREKERKRLLMEEANAKQKGDPSTFVNKRRNFLQKWMSSFLPLLVDFFSSLGRNDSFEPGVGKWVSYLNREKKLDSLVGRRPTAPPAPKGLYIYGNVGSGKTMLMDMFYSATEGIVRHRRRLHFHEAMLQIHDLMHKVWKGQEMEKSFESSISNWVMNLPFDTKIKEWLVEEERYKQEIKMKNILPAVADKFLADGHGHRKGASILCFDEIQTVDVFAIVALSGIVSRLLSTGTVLVATSNRAPRDLNQDGMQKEIFQEFLTKLEEHSENILIGGEIDYRRHIAKNSIDKACYFWPLDRTKIKEFENAWNEIVGQSGGSVTSQTLPVMFGRTLEVFESCNGVARFTFEFLCGQPIGAADYIAIAKTYHTIFVADIPVMSMRIRDKARRFITLVDELYNHHCCLYCSAAASIDDLFQGTEDGMLFDLESFQFETEIEGSKLRRDVTAEGNVSSGGTTTEIVSLLSGQEEMFAFQRAVSRLIEMQTSFYLEGVGSVHPYFQER
ncbi:hypothetical protein OROHE_020005 [Orobanche hederae]